MVRRFAIACAVGVLLLGVKAGAEEGEGAAPAPVETKVSLSGLHICCGSCTKGINNAVAKVEGAKVAVDAKAKTAAVSAADAETVQKALDAIAAAGYHGATGDEKLAIKDDSGAPEGKVKSLKLSGAHNCCGGCNKGLVAAVKKVEGVTDAATAQKVVTVTGDFDAKAVVKAANDAGYHVKAAE